MWKERRGLAHFLKQKVKQAFLKIKISSKNIKSDKSLKSVSRAAGW